MMDLTNASPSQWYVRAARIGLSAKGVVYCLTGLLALMAALHIGGRSASEAGTGGVFGFVEEQPMGKVLLWMIAIGLVCYVVFRLIQAFRDTEHKGDDRKGLSKRFAYFISGIMYAGVAVLAFRAALDKDQGQGDARKSWTAALLSKDGGEWLVLLIALVFAGIGIYQIFRAVSGKYRKYVQDGLRHDAAGWISKVGVAGYAARGVVWLIVAWLFFKAARQHNANAAGGTNDAFGWLQQSYGSVLLAVIAGGLVCYGIFMFIRARYQHFHY